MNQQERFLNTMRFKPIDRVPFWFPDWLMEETRNKWRNEGYFENYEELSMMYEYDTVDDIDIPCGFSPYFEKTILKEDEENITYINFDGVVMKEYMKNTDSYMPQFIEYPVKCRGDFEKLQYRLQLNENARFPKNWNEKCSNWKHRTIPLRLFGDSISRRESGFFGPLRSMMGLENLAYTFYDDPAFVEEMMDNRVELTLSILEKVLRDTTIDFFMFWEDMAYKNGPLLSPEMFKKYMVPRYRRITDFLRSKGVDIIFVDSDGDISQLIPLWLEAGVNGMYPIEVQSGMDIVKLKREYGKDLLMIGGIDKMVFSKGKSEVDEEIKRILSVMSKGGYIPAPDHGLPPQTSFENFKYFMQQFSKVIK